MSIILLYFSTKSTKVDVLYSIHLGPTDVAAADRPEIVITYFMKQGTNAEVTEAGPIELAEGGEVFALNPICI